MEFPVFFQILAAIIIGIIMIGGVQAMSMPLTEEEALERKNSKLNQFFCKIFNCCNKKGV